MWPCPPLFAPLPYSKLSSEVVNKAVDTILAFSAGKDIQVNDKTVVKGKKRKFLETVELQIGEWRVVGHRVCFLVTACAIGPAACATAPLPQPRPRHYRANVTALKNYDPSKDKRFNGTFRLPVPPRPAMRVCVLGHEQHCTEAKALGVDALSADDLKKFNKNNKMIKKMGALCGAVVCLHGGCVAGSD